MLGYWFPVVLCVAPVFLLAAQPNLKPRVSFPLLDKLEHMLEYGLLDGAAVGAGVQQIEARVEGLGSEHG